MALVTAPEVRTVMGEPDTTNCDSEIAVADAIVTDQLVGKGLSDAALKNIELYLAAHIVLLTLENGPLAKKVIDLTQEAYHNVYQAGFASTRFGQLALMMDTTGTLAQMAANAIKPMNTALFTVVGSPRSGWDCP